MEIKVLHCEISFCHRNIAFTLRAQTYLSMSATFKQKVNRLWSKFLGVDA